MLYSSPTHQNSSDKSNILRANEASTVRPASNVAHKLLVCKNKYELSFFYAEYLRLHGYESCADTFYFDVCVCVSVGVGPLCSQHHLTRKS